MTQEQALVKTLDFQLDVHDLRRTWGTYLLEQGVIPSVVLSFGGWEDWDTFRKHSLGEFSPEAIRRERGKVDFLEGGGEEADVVHPGTMPTLTVPRSTN